LDFDTAKSLIPNVPFFWKLAAQKQMFLSALGSAVARRSGASFYSETKKAFAEHYSHLQGRSAELTDSSDAGVDLDLTLEHPTPNIVAPITLLQ